MNRRIMMIIIVSAGLLLVGAVVLLVVVMLQQPKPDTTTSNTNNSTTTTTETSTTTNSTTTNDAITVEDTTPTTSLVLDDEAALRRVISNFAERFGSYSSDTNYENIALSRSLMTATMEQAADKIMSNNDQQADTFYSVESRVMTTTLTDYTADATGATAEVDVRQTIIEGQANPSYRNQTARLTLVKVGGTWKVDSFKWL